MQALENLYVALEQRHQLMRRLARTTDRNQEAAASTALQVFCYPQAHSYAQHLVRIDGPLPDPYHGLLGILFSPQNTNHMCGSAILFPVLRRCRCTEMCLCQTARMCRMHRWQPLPGQLLRRSVR